MKRSFSLRSQLFGLMALLVFLQSLALVLALLISRVFFMLDAEAFRLFDNTTSTRTQTYNASVGQLVASIAEETEMLSQAIQSQASEMNIPEHELYLHDDAYLRVASASTEALLSLLGKSNLSGAFVVLNGSNAHKDDAVTHSSIYIRNSAQGSSAASATNYQLEVGPISVSQQYTIPTSVNWRLDIPLNYGDDLSDAFFTQPMWAATQFHKVEIERYGYWGSPVDILQDGQRVVTYTMPLMDGDGNAFGVIGVEISMSLFTQYYLPNTDLPYQNSFYAIAAVGQDQVLLDWYIPSGPLAQVYLRQNNWLPLHAVSGANVYETELEGLGDMYCSAQQVVMYSRNSPFYEDSWWLLGFVPKEILHETSAGVRSILTTSILMTTIISFVAIFGLVYITTRKISGLSKYIEGMSPYTNIQFKRTGIREIDELTEALEKLNRSVMNASKTTSKILELTLMPIGGFEISSENNYVVLTEYIYQLLGIPLGTEVSKESWQQIHDQLVQEPAPNYENIYKYTDQEGAQKWLRILESATETGSVGIILDASKDIEEHRRLAHELDYDALTHLYSRTAFKREAHHMIMRQPDKIGAMIFVDLDNLKYTNDTFGHDMGDRLIIRAGEMFRQFELYGGIVSRISGDEFAIYLHGYDTKDEVRDVLYKQYDMNEEYMLRTPDGQTQRIRFSSGVAFYPSDSDNVTDLLKLSDYAMYEVKHSQKGMILEFNKDSYTENAYLLENREAINLLLDEKLIRFAFQPIVDIRTGEVYAYEALMRPLLDNFKSPLEILSVAAAQSKLGQLERLVMITAFQTIHDRKEELGDKLVFVNSIPSQFLSAEDRLYLEREFPDVFPQTVIEITEAENDSPEQLKQKTAFVRKNAMKLAIDDFGSGYSNEIRILSITPDIVKVDIELITNIDIEPDKQKLVANLISFCRPKGILMVAEGVERREELAKLIELGVDYVQGYYTGRPDYAMQPITDKVKKEILFLQGK